MSLYKIVNVIRSIIFNFLFFSTLLIFLILGLPLIFVGSSKYVYLFWYYLSLFIDCLVQKVADITYTIEGLENRLNTPAIYAVRHESTWETLVLVHFFKEPIFLIKKELSKIPIFGTLAKKAKAISIDRENGIKALMGALERVKEGISMRHSVIMFPEGTRVAPGEHVELKRGIALFYAKAECPVIPVVHNSGTFWSRRSFIKTPGNIIVRFLPPIEPGLSKDEFMKRLNFSFEKNIDDIHRSTKNVRQSQ